MRLKDAINGAGIMVQDKYVAEDFRLAGITKKDKGFCIHLRQDPRDTGAKTLVSIHWEKEADEEFWRTIVLPLAPVGPS